MEPNKGSSDIEEQEEKSLSISDETTENLTVVDKVIIAEKNVETSSISATHPDNDTYNDES